MSLPPRASSVHPLDPAVAELQRRVAVELPRAVQRARPDGPIILLSAPMGSGKTYAATGLDGVVIYEQRHRLLDEVEAARIAQRPDAPWTRYESRKRQGELAPGVGAVLPFRGPPDAPAAGATWSHLGHPALVRQHGHLVHVVDEIPSLLSTRSWSRNDLTEPLVELLDAVAVRHQPKRWESRVPLAEALDGRPDAEAALEAVLALGDENPEGVCIDPDAVCIVVPASGAPTLEVREHWLRTALADQAVVIVSATITEMLPALRAEFVDRGVEVVEITAPNGIRGPVVDEARAPMLRRCALLDEHGRPTAQTSFALSTAVRHVSTQASLVRPDLTERRCGLVLPAPLQSVFHSAVDVALNNGPTGSPLVMALRDARDRHGVIEWTTERAYAQAGSNKLADVHQLGILPSWGNLAATAEDARVIGLPAKLYQACLAASEQSQATGRARAVRRAEPVGVTLFGGRVAIPSQQDREENVEPDAHHVKGTYTAPPPPPAHPRWARPYRCDRGHRTTRHTDPGVELPWTVYAGCGRWDCGEPACRSKHVRRRVGSVLHGRLAPVLKATGASALHLVFTLPRWLQPFVHEGRLKALRALAFTATRRAMERAGYVEEDDQLAWFDVFHPSGDERPMHWQPHVHVALAGAVVRRGAWVTLQLAPDTSSLLHLHSEWRRALHALVDRELPTLAPTNWRVRRPFVRAYSDEKAISAWLYRDLRGFPGWSSVPDGAREVIPRGAFSRTKWKAAKAALVMEKDASKTPKRKSGTLSVDLSWEEREKAAVRQREVEGYTSPSHGVAGGVPSPQQADPDGDHRIYRWLTRTDLIWHEHEAEREEDFKGHLKGCDRCRRAATAAKALERGCRASARRALELRRAYLCHLDVVHRGWRSRPDLSERVEQAEAALATVLGADRDDGNTLDAATIRVHREALDRLIAAADHAGLYLPETDKGGTVARRVRAYSEDTSRVSPLGGRTYAIRLDRVICSFSGAPAHTAVEAA